MARVVQQRSSPPYLLILFVFLFFIATAVAVVVYLDADKVKKEDAKLQETMRKLAGKELDTPRVAKMMENYERAAANPQKGPPVTVVGQLEERVNRLTQLVTGDERHPDPESVAEEAYAVLKGERPGLAHAVLNAYKEQTGRIDEERAKVLEKDAQIATLRGELDAKTKQLADAAGATATEREQLNARIKELDQKLADAQDAREKALAALQEEKKKEIDGLNQTIALHFGAIGAKDREIADLKKRLWVHEGALADPNKPRDLPVASPSPDGKIYRVSGQVAYIDAGTEKRIRPGLTFAVYPSTGIPGDPNVVPKARIVVVTPDKKQSQCRIVQMNEKDPILVGDLIHNVAFDPERTYKFAVEGLFDLYNTGLAGAQGTEEVKGLIRRFGGTVVTELGTDTDYLVVGAEPPAPAQASDDDPPQVKAVREELIRQRDQYARAVAKAQQLRIPVLNVNRFLDLTGYDRSLGG